METRLRVLSVIGAIFFLLIIIRLVQFQVVQGARYFRLAEMNRIRQSVIPAPRGRIFDRNGILIATTRPAFSISVIPAEVDSMAIDQLASIADIDFQEVWQRIKRNRNLVLPIKIKRDITFDLVAKIEESLNNISTLSQAVSIETEPIRYYPLSDTFSHVIGYVNEIQNWLQDHKNCTGYCFIYPDCPVSGLWKLCVCWNIDDSLYSGHEEKVASSFMAPISRLSDCDGLFVNIF